MKKVCLALLLLLLCAMLGGCLLEPAENLYAPPKQSVDYYNLLSAIESAMPQGASYSAPVRGENQLAVQRVNLDDDPEDEAVAFWKTDGEKPLTIAVFDNKNGSFELMASLELAGSAFTQVQYVQIDGEAGNEIVFGRQISDQLPQLLCVYTMRDGALCELLNTGYETYMTADLNADGLQDIFLLNADGDATNGAASLYRWKDGELTRSQEQKLTTPVGSVKRVIYGAVSVDVPAVFVASQYGEDSTVTDIFALRGEEFVNLCAGDSIERSVKIVRGYFVYCCDIDGDGLIELPRLVDLPAVEGDDYSDDQKLISWYNLSADGTEKEKLLTYHSYSGGWFFTVPTAWRDRLTVTRELDIGKTLCYRFYYRAGEKRYSLFSLTAISGSNVRQTVEDSGWSVLSTKGDTTYAARLDAGAERYGLSLDILRENFRYIRVEWKTGEINRK